MRSLFIHAPSDLDAAIPGGVQLCSREFLEIVRAASAETALLPVTVTRSPLWRLRRRLALGSYLLYRPEEIRGPLASAIQSLRPTHIFINRTELARLASLAAELAPAARVVVMSHGNQSGDDLYEAAGPGGRRNRGLVGLTAAWRLGCDLVTESRFRHGPVHAVCVMSDEEAVLERWLGARRTIVLPRIIHPRPLDWQPVPGRVGFVGTLDHTPNRVALQSLCARLATRASSGMELRLVGGPEPFGRELSQAYPFVRYLGRLDNEALQQEVTTWSLFLNPIFWLSRGASMKLAQSLAWAIPALSTAAGARGYRIGAEQVVITDNSAEAFATRINELISNPAQLSALRANLLNHNVRWPTKDSLAEELRARLS